MTKCHCVTQYFSGDRPGLYYIVPSFFFVSLLLKLDGRENIFFDLKLFPIKPYITMSYFYLKKNIQQISALCVKSCF